MKTLVSNTCRAALLLGVLLLMNHGSKARSMNEKMVEKARYAVEQAAPDDWYTLARSAKKCIRRGVNLREAVAWLEASVRIKRAPYNLEVQGDYFAKHRLPERAVRAYAESYRIGVLTHPHYGRRNRDICLKIQQQVLALGSSYGGNLEEMLLPELSRRSAEAVRHHVNQVW